MKKRNIIIIGNGTKIDLINNFSAPGLLLSLELTTFNDIIFCPNVDEFKKTVQKKSYIMPVMHIINNAHRK